mmetsp:Transcript_29774/g.53376  ORF Transcript_29774/g.53376 Transcript_29774/m.53376 type:complete len:272 (-) Transcript_29774:271-1086(-)
MATTVTGLAAPWRIHVIGARMLRRDRSKATTGGAVQLRVMGAEGNGPSHQPTGATRRQAVTHPRKKYKQPKQTEEKGAIVLSLSDLAYGRPPWKLKKQASLNEIDLDRLLPSAVLKVDMSGQTAASNSVDVLLRVENVGGGFYVKGSAFGEVALVCCACSAQCRCDVSARFEVWLSRDERNIDDIGPNEVPWPQHLRAVDLTEVAAAAMCDEILEHTDCAVCASGDSVKGLSPMSTGETPWGGRERAETKSSGQMIFGDLVKLRESLKKSS